MQAPKIIIINSDATTQDFTIEKATLESRVSAVGQENKDLAEKVNTHLEVDCWYPDNPERLLVWRGAPLPRIGDGQELEEGADDNMAGIGQGAKRLKVNHGDA
ncbi:hypothetical protein MBM_01534 [Drepanopeziza brunnea f. sp. 'multigermtubi' MB_m1]|uniref:Uncharacterized protein n=1 Tax=Marssonina brunnea f. sp. multigermtubi (strain MB_m1) TaxID=1072389 RepID=K1X6X5_MARBU|nr:uncharacterized protein MBM_01534 [Drepanopeziza brunnea f. sp. 'multigermtubi' MB_m1]EKD20852.1 hypothetical protein MBM_01534 [Drepanopeziza brunnea f. sp. 'multigermtubi' MB_m1]